MREIVAPDRCVGCGLCAAVCPKHCIEMKSDHEGFLHPHIQTEQCINCRLCERECPVLQEKIIGDSHKPSAYAAHHSDDRIVQQSSSGGVFTALAERVLENGGVVYGAAFTDDHMVQHLRITEKAELYRLRGSKYLQSETKGIYSAAKKDLLDGRPVLFSGVPCQIAALKSFLGRDFEHLLCVGTVCHSVPSPRVWKQFLLEAEQAENSAVVSANFREKRSGWENYCLCLNFENGHQQRYSPKENTYMQAFIGGLSTRPACAGCIFKGENHQEDITLADFWGVRNSAPAYFHNEGTSLVLTHTEKGQRALSACEAEIQLDKVDFSAAVQGNPAYTRPSVQSKKRVKFFSELGKKPFGELTAQCLAPTRTEQMKTAIWNSYPVRGLRYIRRLLKKAKHN